MDNRLQNRLAIPIERLQVINDVVASAIKLMAERNHVLAEGAGAVPVAAALSGQAGTGRILCVVSGGNIDIDILIQILGGTLNKEVKKR